MHSSLPSFPTRRSSDLMCRQWSHLALRYPLNELRASWDMGGQALAQRVQDKPPAWGPSGIESLIPEGPQAGGLRSEEHTSELQSRGHLVCRLHLEKKEE